MSVLYPSFTSMIRNEKLKSGFFRCILFLLLGCISAGISFSQESVKNPATFSEKLGTLDIPNKTGLPAEKLENLFLKKAEDYRLKGKGDLSLEEFLNEQNVLFEKASSLNNRVDQSYLVPAFGTHSQVFTNNTGSTEYRITDAGRIVYSEVQESVSDNPLLNKTEAEKQAQIALNAYLRYPVFTQAELKSEILYQNKLMSQKHLLARTGNIQRTLAICSYNGTVQNGDAQVLGRIGRDGVTSSCAAPKTCPGNFNATTSYNYDTHTLVNVTPGPQCLTVTASSNTAGQLIHIVAYLGSFNPADHCQNYLADPGISTDPGTTFTFNLPAGATAVFVVYNPNTPTATTDYTITVDNCPTSSSPCQPIVINSQPANTTACGGTIATFTVDATPSGISYNWQEDQGSGFTYLSNGGVYSGVNTATLTLTGVTSNLSGYRYRCVITCADGGLPEISDPATLTILEAPNAPVISPSSASICLGSSVALNITSSQSAVSTTVSSGTIDLAIPDGVAAGVSSTLNVSGFSGTVAAISVNLNITHTWDGDLSIYLIAPNGNILNLAYQRGGSGDDYTNTTFSSTASVSITSGSPPFTGVFLPQGSLSSGPTGVTPNVTTFAGLFSVPNGNWSLAIRDHFTQDAGILRSWSITLIPVAMPDPAVWSPATGLFNDAGLTSPYVAGTLQTTVHAGPATTTTYAASVSNGTCLSPPTNVTITVHNPVIFTTQPQSQTVCIGSNVTFTVAATGTQTTTQWQISTDGGTNWSDISGATTNTLILNNVITSISGYRYRCVKSNQGCGAVNSSVAVLTVNPLPTVTLSINPASQTQLQPGMFTTITVNSTPAAASYEWFVNGLLQPAITGSSYTVSAFTTGTYSVRVRDVNNCVSTSAGIRIDALASDNLFIYPNPATNVFSVSYYRPTVGSPITIRIFDMNGKTLLERYELTTSPYTRYDFNASTLASGVYIIEVRDLQGRRLERGRLVVTR